MTRVGLLHVLNVMNGGTDGTWTPANLPNLQFWANPAMTTTLYQDSAGTTPATADNDPIGRATNQGLATTVNATQTIVSAKPATDLASINNEASMYWDGTAKFLTLGTTTLGTTTLFAAAGQQFSVFAVYKRSGTGTFTIFSKAGGVAGSRTLQLLITSDNSTYINLRGAQTVVAADAGDADLLGVIWDGSSAVYHTAAASGAISVGTAALEAVNIEIGARTGGAFPWRGNIGDVLVADVAWSASDIAQLKAYLVNKWGIS